MQTFVHGDVNRLWGVVSFDDRFVFAKKLDVNGKAGRGRPSKFNRSEVESLVEGGLVTETGNQNVVPTPQEIVDLVSGNSEVEQLNMSLEVVEETSPENPSGEVVFVNLD